MFQSIHSFLNWLINSSKDPAKLSRTLKSLVSGLVVIFTLVGAGTYVSALQETNLDEIATNISAIVTAGSTLYYLIAKIWNTTPKQ